MNLLMQARKDKLQQINQCVNDLMAHQKQHLVQKESIEKMDSHAIGKMISKAKLILKYKKDGKEIKNRLKELNDLNKSELLFLVATHPVAIPVNEDTLDFPINAQGHNLLVCYYYNYVSKKLVSEYIHDISGNRLGFKNEIDIQELLNISTHLNGKFSREDEIKVFEYIDPYVEAKIQEKNPQTWEELNSLIQKDALEKKNIFKTTKKDKTMEQ